MNATALRQQDTERNQALVRLVIAPLVTCYILWGHAQESFDTQWSWWAVCWALVFCGVSLVLLLDIIRRPGIRTGRRLFTMLNDSLDSGHVEPRLENVALHTLLQQLVQQNREAARWANVEVRLHARPLYVLGDPALLTTMVQNLLSNALKYAPGRRVLIGCRTRSGAVRIEVYDQGRGIGEEHQDKVFEEFYRVARRATTISKAWGWGLPSSAGWPP